MKKAWKNFNFKLFGAIFLTLLIPVVYRTLRLFFIGTLPNTNSFSIVGNLQWINVLFEILEEAFLLPCFFTLNYLTSEKNTTLRNRKIIWQILIITIIYVIIITFLASFTQEILKLMSVQNITSEVVVFVRVEFFARLFMMLGKLGVIFLIAQKRWLSLIIILIIETSGHILLDLFLVSDNHLSLQKGVTWISYNQLILASFMVIIYYPWVFYKYDFKWADFRPKIFFHIKSWGQYFFSGVESFVRNAFFIWFVIKTINRLTDDYSQGDFWVTNSFIWDWLLLPILALSQFLNRDHALEKAQQNLKNRLIIPMIIVTITIVIWLILIPIYEPFVKVVLNNTHSQLISHLILLSLGFYITFALNDPLDKIMLADGQAQLILIQSLFTNVIVYLPYYFAKTTMTIEDVAIMMGLALMIDSLITIFIFLGKYRRDLFPNNKKSINFSNIKSKK